MTGKPRLWIIVPVLNEAGNVARLMMSFRDIAAEFQEYSTIFLMIDDGSTDGTAQSARALAGGLEFDVLTHPTNLGPGRAFGTAFKHLAGRLSVSDWVVTIEGDNTSRLELLRQMMTRSAEGFDVVLASPYLYGGGISNTTAYRVVLSQIANVFVKEALGLHGIVTMSSFFRLYRGATLRRLQACFGDEILERAGFESMIELLLKLVFMRFTISEVAMVLDTSQRAGKSKMRIGRTALNYLTLWKDKGRWLARVQAAGARSVMVPDEDRERT
jgi:glycosyltransferase involved in cell wall biosynthesis